MIKAAMDKIKQNIIKHFGPRFVLQFSYDLCVDEMMAIYDYDYNTVIIGKEIIRTKSKKTKRAQVKAECSPEELQENIINFLKRQRHPSWYIKLVFEENTYGLYTRDLVGLGAVVGKWDPGIKEIVHAHIP
jgi:hypothetical protein